jgi:hypothetical protein
MLLPRVRTRHRSAGANIRWLWLLLGSLLATACGQFPMAGVAPLPTALATAAPLSALISTAASGGLPPTWTPEPFSTAVHQETGEFQPRTATEIPAVRQTIPTNTPIPPTATPTATPTKPVTPTPYVSYIPNLPPSSDVVPSKLSLHVLRNNDPAILEFVRRAQPVVIKAIGEFGFLAEAKALSPYTITIGRVDDIYIQNYIGSPEEAAREYVDKHLQTYLINSAVDYWEGWNEPDPPTPDLMRWYTRFEQERVRLMSANGLHSAIGGFPPGVPEMHEFELFIPAIETAIEHQAILTIHEGDLGTGDLRYLYGSPLPGYPAYPDRGSGTFRYRWFYREFLEPANLVIPLVISELDFAGWDHTNETDFLEQLKWYDQGVRQDGYVMGFTIFTAGASGFSMIWDINHLVPELTDYVISQR